MKPGNDGQTFVCVTRVRKERHGDRLMTIAFRSLEKSSCQVKSAISNAQMLEGHQPILKPIVHMVHQYNVNLVALSATVGPMSVSDVTLRSSHSDDS